MTAAELREALDREIIWKRTDVIKTAARLWLRILEGDEQLVEQVARALEQGPWKIITTVDRPLTEGHLFAKARAVLAAITEEEKE